MGALARQGKKLITGNKTLANKKQEVMIDQALVVKAAVFLCHMQQNIPSFSSWPKHAAEGRSNPINCPSIGYSRLMNLSKRINAGHNA